MKTNVYALKTQRLILFFCLIGAVHAADFDTCLAEIKRGDWGLTGGTDNAGNPIANISEAKSITYELCAVACGAGPEPFQWNTFSQQFSAWLLPYLALVAQLPFGATDNFDNVMSVVLSVGSPTLAAYSLALTVLNGHWIARRFSSVEKYPNAKQAVQVLSRLQQSPLLVTEDYGLLASLVILPQNDRWWAELVELLEYTHTWSISSVASIIWVSIAYVFTVIDSFTGTIVSSTLNANGQGVGSAYLWLLPVVIGWLQLGPKCNSVRLRGAVNRANAEAYLASDQGRAVLAEDITPDRALSLAPRMGSVRRDEMCSPPIMNYSRWLAWTHSVETVYAIFETATARSALHQSVDPNVPWTKNAERGTSATISPVNREGTLQQVTDYAVPLPTSARSHWAPGVFSRFFVASLMALGLTWSTTGAAVIVVWFTPTRGLGCRSGAYLLYGAFSTLIWILLVLSSFLAHYSAQRPSRFDDGGFPIYSRASRIAATLSIVLRRVGKVLAACNAIWIVVACIFQFSSFFDRCYCNSSVLHFGYKRAYDVIDLVASDISTMKVAWAGGVAMALGFSFLFILFVNIYINPPLAAT
ncbi:unnamed protein product [Mycena citricolor]|uniref:Uncharacterized protein n=1 Tax=Mycena citricolor TaxID=2018698 RepID=A0AAD2JU81_9AGAR|nr:unnamed protein product [Mycena citricolor]